MMCIFFVEIACFSRHDETIYMSVKDHDDDGVGSVSSVEGAPSHNVL